MKKRGKFVVVTGIDGCGKGQLAACVKRHFGPQNVVCTREPGGTPTGEKLRDIILSKNEAFDSLTTLLIMNAARREHVLKVIKPALEEGKVVFCERFAESSWAYQLFAEKCFRLQPLFETLHDAVCEEYVPDFYILIDAPADVGIKRKRKSVGEDGLDWIEKRRPDYHGRVREGLRRYVETLYPSRHSVVDGLLSQEAVQDRVVCAMDNFLASSQ